METKTDSQYLQLVAEKQGAESITQRVYQALRSDILRGALKPGLRLKVEQLRKEYGVGTSPLREALSLLTSDCLVERIDQRGFRVSPVSQREFDELLKTRCWLEEQALRESIAHATEQWHEQLVLSNYRLSRIPRSSSTQRFVANADWEAAHKGFHTTLIAQCGSSIMLRFCHQLYDQNVRYRQLSGSTAYPERDVTEEHCAICDAVLNNDADLAVQLLRAHYEETSLHSASVVMQGLRYS